MQTADQFGIKWGIPESSLCVTATAAAGAGFTLTLPASAGQFHYVTNVKITKFAAALLVAAAVPVQVTTTNLPGSPIYDFAADAAPAGSIAIDSVPHGLPFRSLAAGTATTYVAPAVANVIWRISVWYTVAS